MPPRPIRAMGCTGLRRRVWCTKQGAPHHLPGSCGSGWRAQPHPGGYHRPLRRTRWCRVGQQATGPTCAAGRCHHTCTAHTHMRGSTPGLILKCMCIHTHASEPWPRPRPRPRTQVHPTPMSHTTHFSARHKRHTAHVRVATRCKHHRVRVQCDWVVARLSGVLNPDDAGQQGCGVLRRQQLRHTGASDDVDG